MQLNETAARIDGQIETVAKKIEKIQHDTQNDQEQNDLTFKQNYAGPGSKQ